MSSSPYFLSEEKSIIPLRACRALKVAAVLPSSVKASVLNRLYCNLPVKKTMRMNPSFTVTNISVKISQKQIKALTGEIHHPVEARYGSQPSRDDCVDAESVTQ